MGITHPRMTRTWPLHKRQGGLQEPANGARGGHPSTVPYSKMSSKGHTELQISQSRAKKAEEAAGDIRFCVVPQKMGENAEKLMFLSKQFEIFRNCPNASEHIQMHPNLSERIWTGPGRYEQVQKLQKTKKKLAKTSKKLR